MLRGRELKFYLGSHVYVAVAGPRALRRAVEQSEGFAPVAEHRRRTILLDAFFREPARFIEWMQREPFAPGGSEHARPTLWADALERELKEPWPSISLVEKRWLPRTGLLDARPLVPEPITPIETDWVQLRFVDENDEPVSDLDFVVEFADAKVRRGSPGDEGMVAFDPIAAGSVRVEFALRPER